MLQEFVTVPMIVNMLKKLYHSSPLFVIKTYAYIYQAWHKLRSYWLPVHLYQGRARAGDHPIKFSYLGWNPQLLNYWLERIFERYEKIPAAKKVLVWRINRYLGRNSTQSDLVIVEVNNKFTIQRTNHLNGFVLPRWLKMYLDVETSLSIIKKQGDIHRRIRKYDLEVVKGTSTEDFEFFYEKMHKPYIVSRHKDYAFVEDYKRMLEQFKQKESTLYFILKDGNRVAGMYEQGADEFPYMYALGILDASDEIRKMGVIGALYHFALEDHKKNSIKRVNIGGSSPLLSDGVTRYKISLGAKVSEIQHQDNIRIKLLPLQNSNGTREFLASNAFTYFENNEVNCAIFKDTITEETEQQVQRLYTKTLRIGVSKTRVLCFDTENEILECSGTND